jgi:hypothetical protein
MARLRLRRSGLPRSRFRGRAIGGGHRQGLCAVRHRGHVAVLTRERLSRPADAPNAPVVKFVKPLQVRNLSGASSLDQLPYCVQMRSVEILVLAGFGLLMQMPLNGLGQLPAHRYRL